MKKQNVRTLSFIVSTFTYLLIGAAIFDALESQTEENIKTELDRIETYFKDRYNISTDEYRTFEDIVNRYHPYRTYPQWKFTGAFYFSLTVITTIGYGHSTPQTVPGKMFCMLYAIVGIPLCLIMFQSVGERLNHFASFSIQLFKKCLRFKQTEVNQTEMVCVAGIFAVVVITGGAAMFSHYEGWTYFNSIYYCVITLTTIGFGDFVALQQERNNLSNTTYTILSFTFILFGLTVVASSINLLVLKFLTMNTDDERREEYTRKAAMTGTGKGGVDGQEDTMSQSDLLNVLNGSVLCMFEPTDLNDLRRENSIQFCSSFVTRSGAYNDLRRRLLRVVGSPLFGWLFRPSAEFALNNRREPADYRCEMDEITRLNQPSSAPVLVNSYSIESLNQSGANVASHNLLSANKTVPVKCASCCVINNNNNNMLLTTACKRRKKKPHYTVRRGPGKISHLLIPNRLNSFADVTGARPPRQRDNGDTDQLPPANIYNIDIFIDEDENEDEDDDDDEDCLTTTNVTTMTNLTTNPNKSRPHLLSVGNHVGMVRSRSENNSSQNVTDGDASEMSSSRVGIEEEKAGGDGDEFELRQRFPTQVV